MTKNLSIRPEDGYAVYLPAISSSYCHWASQWDQKINQSDKDGVQKFKYRQPKNISPDAKELFFLDENNGCFHYNAALYSAGHAEITDLVESQRIENLVHSRDKAKTVIVADSGGYQIASSASGSSVSKFDWANPTSASNDEIRLNVLRWMESVADYSMMLDVPTAAIGNPKAKSINTFADCIEMTRYNADFFVKNRIPGKTKILNVLQGRTLEEADTWWDIFKDYPFEGWALGGANARNAELMLSRIIRMRDNNYIGGDKHWMHVLGSSRLTTSCILTEIQRNIRKTIDEQFTISYDSATPFVVASKGYVLTQNIFDASKKNPRFSYLTHRMVETAEAMGSDKMFPFTSEPGRFMSIGDICVRDPKVSGTKTSWDSFSYVLLMWHNLYRQIDAIQEALRIYDMPKSQVGQFIPKDILAFKDFCKEIFITEKPFELIKKEKKFLNSLTGITTSSGNTLLNTEGQSLFDWDDGILGEDDLLFDPSEGRETDLLDIGE